MKAIQRLKQSGLSRAQIAKAIGCTRHAVRFWETGERSPSHKYRERLIELALERGLLLLASDFSKDNDSRG